MSLTPISSPSGTLKLNFDQMVYSDTGDKLRLELSYEIPFTSLSFVKIPSLPNQEKGNSTSEPVKFLSRYRLLFEFFDKGKNIIASEVKEGEIWLTEYSSTVNPDSVRREVVTLTVPPEASQGRVFVTDLFSERFTTLEFPLKKETSRLLLRLFKAGRANPSRTYSLNDTVVIAGEVKSWNLPVDGIRFTVKKGRRNITSDVCPVKKHNDAFQALFILPVSDSSNRTSLNSGEYTVEATLIPLDTITGKTWFRIKIPFFYDDSLWQIKVDQLIYVATYEEIKKLKNTPRPERKDAWEKFWKPKDPNPSTEINENEEEYFERIAYCEKHFSQGDRGYRSDRAKVYVTYGPPDQVESRPFNIDRPAEEIWYYYQNNRTFVFVDRFGSGEFVLSNPRR